MDKELRDKVKSEGDDLPPTPLLELRKRYQHDEFWVQSHSVATYKNTVSNNVGQILEISGTNTL